MNEHARETVAHAPSPSVVFVCSVGCCKGCLLCMGSQIGCHARPCRCSLPCFCDYAHDEPDRTCRQHLFAATQGIIHDGLVALREREALDARFDRVLAS